MKSAIYANPAVKDGKKVDLATLLRTIDEKRSEWASEGVGYVFSGEADNLAETQEAFAIAVATAFVLIYLILAALYESILEPIIIMVTMPLSFSGAFFALGLVGQPLSMFSLMGLILLIGMVGKNATLLIDVANEKREEGYSIAEAILLAGELRLRPILMTTIAMVFGMLPLAFATGQGSSMKSAIGICMIGGLIAAIAPDPYDNYRYGLWYAAPSLCHRAGLIDEISHWDLYDWRAYCLDVLKLADCPCVLQNPSPNR